LNGPGAEGPVYSAAVNMYDLERIMAHFSDGHWVPRNMGVSESPLTGTMKDRRRITARASGRILRKDLYWKIVE